MYVCIHNTYILHAWLNSWWASFFVFLISTRLYNFQMYVTSKHLLIHVHFCKCTCMRKSVIVTYVWKFLTHSRLNWTRAPSLVPVSLIMISLCIYICKTCVYLYICIYICSYTFTYTIYMFTYIYIHMQCWSDDEHLSSRVYLLHKFVLTYICVHIYVYIYIYMYKNICMYVHIHKYKRSYTFTKKMYFHIYYLHTPAGLRWWRAPFLAHVSVSAFCMPTTAAI